MDFLKKNSDLLELVNKETAKYNEFEARVIRKGLETVVGYDVMLFSERIHRLLGLSGPIDPTEDKLVAASDLRKINTLIQKLLTIGEMFAGMATNSEYNQAKGLATEQAIECPKCKDIALDLRNRGGDIDRDNDFGPKNDPSYRLYACGTCKGFGERKDKNSPIEEYSVAMTLEEMERNQDSDYKIKKDLSNVNDPLVLDKEAGDIRPL